MQEPTPYFIRPTPLPYREETTVLNRSAGEEELHLRDYCQVIRKYCWLIVMIVLGVVLATALVIFRMTPIYTAKTTLLIERHSPRVLNIEHVLSEQTLGWDEYDYYKTQYEILRSETLAVQVLRTQGLEHNSLLPGQGRKEREGFVAGLWAKATTWVKEQSWAQQFFPLPSDSHATTPLETMPRLINAYLAMLDIEPVRSTRLVKVAFHTPNPELSARLANAHAEAYIRQGLKLRTQAGEEAQRFLEEKLVEVKERLEKSETALNRYRRDKGIISLDDKENIVVERLVDLNKRLTEAEADRITLEAQVRLIRKRNYDSLPAVLNSPLIETLTGQLIHLEGEYAQLSTKLKLGYPRLAQLKAQVEEIRRRLQQEMQKVVGGIESAYLAAQAKEQELRTKMEEQRTAALGLKDASVEYAILAREVDSNSQLYDNLLQRMKEVGVAAELHTSNVSVIDTAKPSFAPSRPKKVTSLLLSVLIGIMGGVGLAFFLEYWNNTFQTPEEVKRFLQLPNLGVIPDFFSLNYRTSKLALNHGKRAAHPALAANECMDAGWEPGAPSKSQLPSRQLVSARYRLSVITEAYRALRTAILFSRAGEPPKTVLFASGAQGEGKTSTTINTAVLFAQMGAKVLVIDADLRRSSCHKILRVENKVGLSEYLTGQRESYELMKSTFIDNLSLLPSGLTPPNPAELVGSRKMYELLTSLQEQYNYIFIDSPPVMPVSDTVLLSAMVDGVVLVVKGQETPRQVVKRACARLSDTQAKILGVVLNGVSAQSQEYAHYYHHYYLAERPLVLPIPQLFQNCSHRAWPHAVDERPADMGTA